MQPPSYPPYQPPYQQPPPQKPKSNFFSTTFGVITGIFTCACILPIGAFIVLGVIGAAATSGNKTTASPSTPSASFSPPENDPYTPKTPAQLKEQKKQQAAAEKKASEESDFDGLVLMNKTLKGTHNEYTGEITGIVENRRDNKVSLASITFNLYDKNGAQVGTALGTISGLEAGGKWKFKAVTLDANFSTYKVSDLSGF